MARPGRQAFEKRQREKKRKERAAEKQSRKEQRKADRDSGAAEDDIGFDLDLEQIDIEQTLALPDGHPLRVAVEKKLAQLEAEEAEESEDGADAEADGSAPEAAGGSPAPST